MISSKSRNYKILLFSASILSFANGIFAPFWVLFVKNIGGSLEKFGFAIGLMALAQSITSYFTGKYSDRMGRKIFLITAGFGLSFVIFSYTLISTLIMLYILQVLSGIFISMYVTMETIFLGDITEKSYRGKNIGKYNALMSIMAAVAIMIGGIIVGRTGFKTIFYIASFLILISVIILLKIDERKRK